LLSLLIHFPFCLQAAKRKAWERFREIPEWIDAKSKAQGVSPDAIIQELEQMRGKGSGRKGVNALGRMVCELRKKEKVCDYQALRYCGVHYFLERIYTRFTSTIISKL
jgi:hypothetical protein